MKLHQLINADNAEYAARKLKILTIQGRSDIINLLIENGGLTVTQILTKLHFSQGETSQHLMLLYRYGMVSREHRGKFNIYSPNMKVIEEILKISEDLYCKE